MLQDNHVPSVSVIMEVLYRQSDLSCLQRSVQSILNQSFADFELIICDDGSSEAAQKYLEQLKDTRIRLIRPGQCYPLPCKLNICLREARGRFIARMDDDDYSYPSRFERQIHELESLPSEYGFVGCNVNLIRNNKYIGLYRLPEQPNIRDFYIVQPFIHPTLFFRREALISVNGYSEEKRCELCEDYDLLLRLYARNIRGKNIQSVLLDYTIPINGKGKRKLRHRWNEATTRFVLFRELKLLPQAFIFVIKPLLVELLPDRWLQKIKEARWGV